MNMKLQMHMKSLLSAGIAAFALGLVATGAQAAPASGLVAAVNGDADRPGQVEKVSGYGYGRGYYGRGFYGRGFYGRGFYGRGFYGRGFYGRGFYGRGHYGRGFYGRGWRHGYRRW